MKATKQWLARYIGREFTDEQIADGLTRAGIEVESYGRPGGDLTGVRVARIVSCQAHPDAEKLQVCTVDAGTGEPCTIVCGAPNCRPGILVPAALPGATLPDGTAIRETRIRGVLSGGMLCSAAELGIDPSLVREEDRSGLWVLPDDLTPGEELSGAIGFDDTVFELGITPNRADCFGMINVARELAMMYEEEIRIPPVVPSKETPEIRGMVDIEIPDPDLCHRYLGRIVRDIRTGPSPAWMQACLRAAGIRPISNIVDVTNFVMMETGQPLHAFDYDTIRDARIVVRTAHRKETIRTLDGVERPLDPEILVIADSQGPIAVAGVMGGYQTEVTANTRNILLESAHFHHARVRNGSRLLGMRSEASGRFERGVSPEGSHYAVDRAVELIRELGAGTPVEGVRDAYPRPQETGTISLSYDSVNRTLGTGIPGSRICGYLGRLGFSLEAAEESVRVRIPAYRMDLTEPIDLVEEVARIHGYDRIPTTLPLAAAHTERQDPAVFLAGRIRECLVGLGLCETLSYAFFDPGDLERMGLSSEHPWRQALPLQNPLSEAHSVMRTTLVPGLMHTAGRNLRRNQRTVGIFEIGNVFEASQSPGGLPREIRRVGIALSAEKKKFWYGMREEAGFFELKGIAEGLLARFRVEDVRFESCTDHPAFHPGRTAWIRVGGQRAGILGELHPLVREAFDLPQRVCLAEIDAEVLAGTPDTVHRHRDLPRYPSVTRDIAFSVREDVTDQQIMDVIAEASNEKVVDYRLFDLYNGEQIEAGYKSLAYSLTYQDSGRTLTDGDVNRIHDGIRKSLEQKLAARLRQ